MDLENFYVTPCFSHDYQLRLVENIIRQNTQSVCKTREKETDTDKKKILGKNNFPKEN
jgi:hypothetical protein